MKKPLWYVALLFYPLLEFAAKIFDPENIGLSQTEVCRFLCLFVCMYVCPSVPAS